MGNNLFTGESSWHVKLDASRQEQKQRSKV